MNFPPNFFQDELRCGFQVSELMKRAWAAELEVLEIVTDICEQNHITYFADSGTLLGAVRHQGFVPWDDDIDIALLRDDYNRLIQILPAKLPDGFVLSGMYAQTKRLRDATPASHSRVIADEEYWNFPTYLERFHCFPYFRIGIDIFPLDYIPRDSALASAQISLVTLVYTVLCNWNELQKTGELSQHLKQIETLCSCQLIYNEDTQHQLWLLLDTICSLYHADESDDIANFPYYISSPSLRMSKSFYEQTVYLPFENMKLSCPKQYHEILSAAYGDYTTPVMFTAEHEYPFYKKQEAELQNIFREAHIESSVTEFCHNWAKLLGE